MEVFNIFGLIIIIIIMIPNIIFAVKVKNIESKYRNKTVGMIEQLGRFGSMFLMVFNISLFEHGYWTVNGENIYMATIGMLSLLYCFIWVMYFKEATLQKAMALAIIPTAIFLVSGILLSYVLLIITALLFGIGHIVITYNNNK